MSACLHLDEDEPAHSDGGFLHDCRHGKPKPRELAVELRYSTMYIVICPRRAIGFDICNPIFSLYFTGKAFGYHIPNELSKTSQNV